MIYRFKKAYILKNGNKINAGDHVFLDDPDEKSELAEAVETDKGKSETPKKKTTKKD